MSAPLPSFIIQAMQEPWAIDSVCVEMTHTLCDIHTIFRGAEYSTLQYIHLPLCLGNEKAIISHPTYDYCVWYWCVTDISCWLLNRLEPRGNVCFAVTVCSLYLLWQGIFVRQNIGWDCWFSQLVEHAEAWIKRLVYCRYFQLHFLYSNHCVLKKKIT